MRANVGVMKVSRKEKRKWSTKYQIGIDKVAISEKNKTIKRLKKELKFLKKRLKKSQVALKK